MFPELNTERFYLRQIEPDDLSFIFEGLSDPVAVPHYGVYFYSLEETKKQLEWYDNNWKDGTGINWKIVSKESGENVGVISVYNYKPEHHKAELGYWLLPKFWKQGIATEVLKPVIDYWQKEKQLHRLEAFIETENEASIRLLEKAGFTLEGTMRDCEIKFDKYISLHIYSLITPNRQEL
jgi:[ribosomal protein S5]-alanine N-acetyltransferase